MMRVYCVFVLVALMGVALNAQAATEKELLLRSMRPRAMGWLGSFERLQARTIDVAFSPDNRRLEGHATVAWTNATGRRLETVFVRIAANAATENGVRWTDVRASIDGRESVQVDVSRHSASILQVRLPTPLAPRARLTLVGRLEATLERTVVSRGPGGTAGAALHRPSSRHSGTFACSPSICTAAGFAPEVPAIVKGAFDLSEPADVGDVGTYSEPFSLLLSVVAPKNVQVVATGHRVGELDEGDDRVRRTFVLAGARDVAFVASADFEERETTVRGIRVKSVFRARHASFGARALSVARASLEAFEDAFGPYPWAEFTLCESALDGQAGGVEFASLALLSSGLYADVSDENVPLPFKALGRDFRDELFDFTVRHEVAHQWWHGLVGSHAALEPWVDEPLAQWSALYATRRTMGQTAASLVRRRQIELNFQAFVMMGGDDAPAARPAQSFSDVVEYGALLYGKAPLLFAEIERLSGEKALTDALKRYVTRHRFRRADSAALQSALEQASREHAPAIRRLWRRWMTDAKGTTDIPALGLDDFFAVLGGAPEQVQANDRNRRTPGSQAPSVDE